MIKRFKLCAAAAGVALAIGATAPAQAAVIQLGFLLDSSGSIGSTNWGTIRTGLANAIGVIPVGGADTYEVSVVTFSSSTSVIVNHVLVTDTTVRSNVAAQVAAAPFLNQNTNFNAAFTTLQSVLTNSSNFSAGGISYVNFATDGQPNEGGGDAGGVTARNAIIAAGIDNISIEAIGSGVDQAYLTGSICYPGPCDTTSPYNFPAQGFYIPVANAAGYAAAVEQKIRVVTGQVPEPGTMVLLGAGLLGFGFARRRKV